MLRQAERLHPRPRPRYESGCTSCLAVVVRSSRGRCIALSRRPALCKGLESPSDCSQTPISSLAPRRLLCWSRDSLDRNLLTAGSVGRCVAYGSYGAAPVAGGRCTPFTFVGCSGAPAPSGTSAIARPWRGESISSVASHEEVRPPGFQSCRLLASRHACVDRMAYTCGVRADVAVGLAA